MTDWNLEGQLLIACNCDYGCPCNFNALPTKGFCEGGWLWQINKGTVDGTALDGLAFSLWAAWPGAIHHGDGRAVAYTDARADDAQRAALERLLRGDLGGPWGIFINTYTLESITPAAYEVVLAEHATRAKVGDVVTLEIEPIKNPVSGAEVHPEMVLPEGLVVKRAALAASKVFSVKDGISYDHSGQYTAFGAFAYSS